MACYPVPLHGRYNWYPIGNGPLFDPVLLVDFAANRKYLLICYFGYDSVLVLRSPVLTFHQLFAFVSIL